VAATPCHGTSALSELQFYKMTGSGNDFIVLDGRSTTPQAWSAQQVRALCDRRNGVGADGLVILTPQDPGTVQMAYWNSDGSRGAMCGNAALCCTRLAGALNLTSSGEFCLLTDAGSVRVRALPAPNQAEINLPDVPLRADESLPPGDSGEDWMRLFRVGVPHLVVRVGDVGAVDVAGRGRALRFHPLLGEEGANVNFVGPSSEAGLWLIRTYERGVEGETLACGTGTVAAATALAVEGEAALPVLLRSRGGLILRVRGRLEHRVARDMWLAGEGRLVYRGLWEMSEA
jgi:diaminopimelate epimerase